MALITHILVKSATGPTGLPISATIAITGDNENNLEVSIPATTTNMEVDFGGFTAAQVQQFFMIADGALTIKWNSSGSPDLTKTLTAGWPFGWDVSLTGWVANPLPSTNTKLFVTNAGSVAVVLTISSLLNT